VAVPPAHELLQREEGDPPSAVDVGDGVVIAAAFLAGPRPAA
jgi:hypothetical protein